jgi:pantothenate kinase
VALARRSSDVQLTSWTGGASDDLVARALRLLEGSRRAVLGIAGAPASGKSTLAEMVLIELERITPTAAVLVGMDAFHIGHRVLERRGQVSIKGAPETFDVRGYVALLKRIREATDTVYAPEFHREIEDSIAHTVEIPPQVRLVVTEGNYLLLSQPPWNEVRPLLDEAWFMHLADSERQRRMVARHSRFGHSHQEAMARTYGSDEANAQLVNDSPNAPDVWIEHLLS